eukprot:10217348-Prorocentrum_lima.AAC.1
MSSKPTRRGSAQPNFCAMVPAAWEGMAYRMAQHGLSQMCRLGWWCCALMAVMWHAIHAPCMWHEHTKNYTSLE